MRSVSPGFNRPSSVSSFARVSLSLVALSRRSYPSSPFAPPYQPEAPERTRKTPFSSSVSHHPPSSSVRSHPASTPTQRQRKEIRISNRHHVSMVKSSQVESPIVRYRHFPSSSSHARTAATALGSFAAFADPLPVELGRFPIVISFQSWWCPDMLLCSLRFQSSRSLSSNASARPKSVSEKNECPSWFHIFLN